MVIRIQLFSIQFSHEYLKMLNQNFTIYNIYYILYIVITIFTIYLHYAIASP